MQNFIPELHLILLVIEYVWGALTSYQNTQVGGELLSTIEEIVRELSDNSNTGASPSGQASDSPTLAQRRAQQSAK